MKLPFNLHSHEGSGFYGYSDMPTYFDDDIFIIDEYELEDSEVDFTEYMWMEHEEEFDKIEWQKLEEEELMKQCIENMLEDELDDANDPEWISNFQDMCQYMKALEVSPISPVDIQQSTLNPLAKEFIPSSIAVHQ